MHCPKCLKNVPYGAKYCRSCGEAIPEAERSAAYKKTLWGRLQQLEDWYKTLTLKKLTGSVVFKILILVLILAVGVVNIVKNGVALKILESDAYSAQYNTKLEEYYILTDADEVVLSLYIPNRAESLILTGYDDDGAAIEQRTLTTAEFANADAMRIRKDEYAYLTLEAIHGTDVISQLKFLVLSER